MNKGPSLIREFFPIPEKKEEVKEEEEKDFETLIFDIGTCKARVGYLGDVEPKSLYSVVTLSNIRHGGVSNSFGGK